MPLARPRSLRATLLVTALAAACHGPASGEATAETSDKRAAAPPVETKFAKIESREVQPRLDVSGTLDPDEKSEVASQTAGTVLAVHVDLGVRVRRGDVLVELDPREASLKLNAAAATAESQRARLGLGSREKFDAENVADVRAAREARDLASTEFERTKQLYESGAVSKAALDAAKSQKERADAGYESAHNGASQAWSSMLASQSQAGLSSKSVDDTKVRAPFDGSVVERRISVGEYAGMGRVVAVILRDNPLRFRFDVAEADAGQIALGTPVELSVAAHPGRVFSGVVKRTGASVKVQTRTLPVEAEIPNDDLALRPGFFARASVSLAGKPRPALFVPRAAVAPVGGGFRVFVKSGEKVIERLVTTGSADETSIEVRGHLSPGDEVATLNLDQLSDGARIDAR